jgi:hypothetical protein
MFEIIDLLIIIYLFKNLNDTNININITIFILNYILLVCNIL